MGFIKLTIEDGIAEVVLDRPKVNAMSRALLAELRATFLQLSGDDDVRGALLRAEGNAFSAGLDLKEVALLDPESVTDFLDLMEDAFLAPFAFPKPLAVAVHGHAIAGGMILALCGDYLSMAEGDYKIGLTELQVGVPFPRVAFEAVRNAVPPRALRKLMNEADTYRPAAIWDLGVGDAVCADPVADARAWLNKISARPLDTFMFVKAQRRKEAWERIATTTHAERRALVAAMMASRKELMAR
jgi:enoyl-CoA hydratase